MARGGMRVGEILNLKPADIQERSLSIQNPKSGRVGETVYAPRKLLVRLTDYTKVNKISLNDRIFPISYVAAWSMVKKAGQLLDIELRPLQVSRTFFNFNPLGFPQSLIDTTASMTYIFVYDHYRNSNIYQADHLCTVGR